MPPPWTDEELIILIYFSSWGVDPRGIRDLLWEKCGLEREEQPITVKPKDLAHRLSKQRGSRLYKIKWGPFGRKKWDLAVTDELLVEYIEGYAGRLAIGIDKDEGKAPRHYEKVIVKYTKIEPKEAAKVRIVSPS